MVLKVVEELEQANIAFEQAIRHAVKKGNAALKAIENAASDREVNKAGYFNVDSSVFRLNNAKSRLALEEAHNYQTENHTMFNAIADDPKNELTRTDPLLIQPLDGGSR